MRILQLGNGGGFDFDKTNSSFLIQHADTHILFDCGFNIMDELKSNDKVDLEKIDNVFISHTDEDHIGNLKMLIYWRYFNYGKSTMIICNRNIREDINNYLKHMNTELIGCQSTEAVMFYINTSFYREHIMIGDIDMELTFCNHGSIPTSGVIFTYNDSGKLNYSKKIFISADTKANKAIEDATKDCDLIFHDFSNWDCVTRNVHTCKQILKLSTQKSTETK
jgi:ribonuclease BN (tRNA processing enzyme)